MKYLTIDKKDRWALLIIFIYFLCLLFPLFKCNGYIANWDTFVHLYLSQTLSNGFKNGNFFPSVDLFNGLNYFSYFSSLFYYGFAILSFILFFLPPYLVWNSYLFLIILSLAFSSYYLARKVRFPPRISLLISLAIASFSVEKCCSGYALSTILGIGILPFSFSFIWFPLWISFFISALRRDESALKSRLNIFLAALFAALTFYSHLYTFLVIGGILIIFVIIKLICARNNQDEKKYYVKTCFKIVCLLTIFLLPYVVNYVLNRSLYLSSANFLAVQEPLRYLLDIFIVGNGASFINLLWPIINIFGLLGMAICLVMWVFKRYRDKFVSADFKDLTLSVLIICVFILSGVLTTVFKIKLPIEITYAHYYGRFIAFVKYFLIYWAFFFLYVIANYLLPRHQKVKKVIIVLFTAGMITALFMYNHQNGSAFCYLNKKAGAASGLKTNFISLKFYTEYYSFFGIPVDKGLDKDLEAIIDYLNTQPDDGRVMIDSSYDIPQKFILPLKTNRGFIAELGAWWPSIKSRNYFFAFYDALKNVSESNLDLIQRWFSDFNINYLIGIKNSPTLNQLINHQIFEVALEEESLALLKKINQSQLVEPLTSFGIIIDDSIYYQDYSAALRLYQTINYPLSVLSSKDISAFPAIVSYADFVIIGNTSLNCDKLDEVLNEKIAAGHVFYLNSSQTCDFATPVKALDTLEENIQMLQLQTSNNEVIVSINKQPWFLEIQLTKTTPLIFKYNKDVGIKVFQNDKELKTYLLLPDNVLIIPLDASPLYINY